MRRALLVLSFVVPSAGGAQVPTFIPGARVRVETRGTRIEGRVMAQTTDSITVAAVAATGSTISSIAYVMTSFPWRRSTGDSLRAFRTAVASASITSVQVGEAKSSSQGAINGMKIGAGIGAGGGLLMGLVAGAISGWQIALPVAGFVAASAVLEGTAIGAVVGAEKWTTVYSNPMRNGASPAGRGASALGFSIKF